MKKILLIGLGRIGRGLIIPVFKQAGYSVVGAIRKHSEDKRNYLLQTPSRTIKITLDDMVIMDDITDTFDLIVTSVGRQNLAKVALWYQKKNLSAPVLLAENLPDPINLFPRQIPIVIDRICPHIKTQEDTMTVTVEDYYKLVVLDDPFTRPLGNLANVELEYSQSRLEWKRKQKMFTINTAHLLTAFYGQQRGYYLIEEAIADAEIASRIRSVLFEVSQWLGISFQEAEKKVQEVVQRFAAPLQDPLSRVLKPDKYAAALRYVDVPLNGLRAMHIQAPTLSEASGFLNKLITV